jgi:hypothetical protein
MTKTLYTFTINKLEQKFSKLSEKAGFDCSISDVIKQLQEWNKTEEEFKSDLKKISKINKHRKLMADHGIYG